MAKARKTGWQLLVWKVPPDFGPMLARFELSPIEQGSTTLRRFFPDKQFELHEVEAVAKQLRKLGLKVISSRSAKKPPQHLQHVIHKRKQPKDRRHNAQPLV